MKNTKTHNVKCEMISFIFKMPPSLYVLFSGVFVFLLSQSQLFLFDNYQQLSSFQLIIFSVFKGVKLDTFGLL